MKTRLRRHSVSGEALIAQAYKYFLITFIIGILAIIGEVRCIYKAFNCNWEPVGKAEVFYTVGAFTGTGAIIGWLSIEDK